MKRNKKILCGILCVAYFSLVLISCGKFEAPGVPMTPISTGDIPNNYASLKENTNLEIPVKFTTLCDSGLQSASYIVVNKRASDLNLVFSAPVNIPFNNKTVDAAISIPVRKGLLSVVITIYDKAGKLSSKSINIQSVTPSDASVKTLTNVVMSTDPADNQCFFSMYEANPVFGSSVALTKQDRIDFLLINMGGAKPISCHAYGASDSYYNTSKIYLAGFTSLSYEFISSSKSYVSPDAFDAIKTESDLDNFLDTVAIGPGPKGANYNIISADRRVGDSYTETAVNKGFIIGWGYHTSPVVSPAKVLNEVFALVIVRKVTKKSNGHYVVTFDIKAPSTDERVAFNTGSIAPYAPYPL